MPLAYLPIQAAHAGPEGPRRLVQSSQPAWCDTVPPLDAARVALLSSAAVREAAQPPFVPPEDTSYRAIPADPAVTDLVIDHRSPVGTDARRDLEVVLPRAAFAALQRRGVVGTVAPSCFTFVGGCRLHQKIEGELAPALAAELAALDVTLAVLAPY
ncbi:MAG TPA: hypothetical protein VFE37_16805 [Chloroflexota bacterium]|nr:hypothetical protein [Chloroflexota bacterium]